MPRVLNYLDDHFTETDIASSLPAKFGYTYSYLCKKFKTTYHISPAAYLHNKRMKLARTLLRQGESVTSVSERLCYSSAFNFSRAYKKHFGISPTLDDGKTE